MAKSKLSKSDVDYGNGHKDAHCGICRHFIPADTCEIVAGEIERDMWCKRFLAKKAAGFYAGK